jgi:betaine lipid synthase
VNSLGRTFWRAWFDIDRVSLEPGRRDYLEYRFGTVLNVNTRNYILGAIPYYIWLGSRKQLLSSSSPCEITGKVDVVVPESLYFFPTNQPSQLFGAVEKLPSDIRSKAFDAALANISSNLPLPSSFYQNHHYRTYYDDQLDKHTQFNGEYIYAFTWEDTRVDERILKLKSDDVVLAITSAGDNVLSYALQGPARIHAVDLNPAQNHLLELKVAAYRSLEYEDFWKIFGEGKHADFRSLLISKMSPHLSSRAFQYWLRNIHIFTKNQGGLYDSGGSRHGIRIFRWITQVFGCRAAIKDLLAAKTLNEQREIWHNRVRPVLLSRLVSKFIVSQEPFLWTALGVPRNQLAMLEADHAISDAVCGSNPTAKKSRSHAIWEYMVNTLDPMVESTHIAADNPYYLVCLDGKFSRKCHPDYLSPRAHARLSRPDGLDNLRIHTDEIDEVLADIAPGTLTVAVVMDSMDWFDPRSNAATSQITKLNRALKRGGRVMLRSAALKPWYLKEFGKLGFAAKCMGSREGGACIDRVNMYASCWICTKRGNLGPPTPEIDSRGGPEILSLHI